MLTIPLEKVCYLVMKAREFDVKMEPEVSDPGDNPIDDEDREILFDYPGDPTVEEIRGFLEQINEDEAIDLLALIWVGSGDFEADEWEEAVAAARDAPDERQIEALLSIPLLADYLEAGLDELGYSCLDFEINKL